MNKPEKFKNWLTILEAAKKVGLTDRAISYYVRNEKLTTVKVGRQWLIDPESLREIFPESEV